MTGRDGWLLFGGAAFGAGVMYMLDPDRGKRRRALCRDQLVSAGNKTGMYAGKLSRDLRNRAQGLVAEARARLRREEVADDVLVNRVKAALGHRAVHHRALVITASGGCVTLRGPALASEVDELLRTVASVRGVNEVEDQLEIHETAGGVSSLQGAATAPAAS